MRCSILNWINEHTHVLLFYSYCVALVVCFVLTWCELLLRSALIFSTTILKKAIESWGNKETPNISKRGRNMGKHPEKVKGGYKYNFSQKTAVSIHIKKKKVPWKSDDVPWKKKRGIETLNSFEAWGMRRLESISTLNVQLAITSIL